MKKPRNDQECKELLKQLGRTDEQTEAIMDFAKLTKTIINEPEEKLIETVKKMKKKYNINE